MANSSGRGLAARAVADESAQAVVEAAVVLPVLIVLALVAYNLMRFSNAVARFDRIAPDMVLIHGVSPAGENLSPGAAARAVEEELAAAMDDVDLEIEVICEDASAGASGNLSLSGSLATFRCSMRYRPWPSGFSIAGVDLGAPVVLEYERDVVVDPWKPGVVA